MLWVEHVVVIVQHTRLYKRYDRLDIHVVPFHQTILEYIVYGKRSYIDTESGFYISLKLGPSKIYMQDPPLYIVTRS